MFLWCQIMMVILMMGIFSHKKIGWKPPAPCTLSISLGFSVGDRRRAYNKKQWHHVDFLFRSGASDQAPGMFACDAVGAFL